jgi:general secretion pathway protein I
LLRSRTANCAAMAGFTLIEALVALTIVATSLSAIGALIATSVRGTRSIEGRLARIETARAVATALPDRDQLAKGGMSGDLAGHRWRIDVGPYPQMNTGGKQPHPWVPEHVVLSIDSAAGGTLQIDTVRLRRRNGQ